MTPPESEADQNDAFRRAMSHGSVLIRGAVRECSNEVLQRVCAAIQAYDFARDGDPSGLSDRGSVDVDGQRFEWAIEMHEVGPPGKSVTRRMLVVKVDKGDEAKIPKNVSL